MPVTFNPDALRTEIARRGMLRPCKFLVTFPATISQGIVGAEKIASVATDGTLSLWCESAVLPGVMLETSPVRRYGYGPIENKPWGVRFNDASLVFRGDAGGAVFQFLHAWARAACDYHYVQSMTSRTGINAGQHPFELSYKIEYAADVMISLFDEALGARVQGADTGPDGSQSGGATNEVPPARTVGVGSPGLQVMLREAYPIAVGDAPLAWASIDDYLRIPTTFTFISWYQTGQVPMARENVQSG